jgi:DNA-binding response OmpR family regulator
VLQHSTRSSQSNSVDASVFPPLGGFEPHRVFPDRWGKSPTARVLIVEADPLLRWALAETARRAGFAVVEQPAALDGRRWAPSEEPPQYAVVVVDLRAWPLDVETTRALGRGWGDAGVVAMIPEAFPDASAVLERLGVALVLVKPFDLVGLRSFLEARAAF